MMHLPLLAIIVPLICAFFVPLLDLISYRVRSTVVAIVAVSHLALVLLLCLKVFQGGSLEYGLGGWGPEVGIVLSVDWLSATFAALIALGTSLVVWYSLSFVPNNEAKYFLLLFVFSAGLTGAVLTGDLFNLYVFIEIIALAGFALVAFRRKLGALVAAIKYMIFTILSSLFILLSIAFIYGATGTLNIGQIAASMALFDPAVLGVSAGLFLVGVGLKLAVVPLHAWLPATYGESASPVAALLSGVAHKVPLYILIRFMFLFQAAAGDQRWQSILLALGTVSVVFGHFMALGQTDVRRTLGYSSIAHTGYMLLGLGIGTPLALVAVLLHAVNHLIMKVSAFFSLGMMTRGDQDPSEVSDMQGRGVTNPFGGMVFLISTLALIGVPPLGAFASKWTLVTAMIEADMFIYALLMAAGTIAAAMYYGRIYQVLYRSAEAVPERRWTQEGIALGSISVAAAVAICVALFPAAPRILEGLMRFVT